MKKFIIIKCIIILVYPLIFNSCSRIMKIKDSVINKSKTKDNKLITIKKAKKAKDDNDNINSNKRKSLLSRIKRKKKSKKSSKKIKKIKKIALEDDYEEIKDYKTFKKNIKDDVKISDNNKNIIHKYNNKKNINEIKNILVSKKQIKVKKNKKVKLDNLYSKSENKQNNSRAASKNILKHNFSSIKVDSEHINLSEIIKLDPKNSKSYVKVFSFYDIIEKNKSLSEIDKVKLYLKLNKIFDKEEKFGHAEVSLTYEELKYIPYILSKEEKNFVNSYLYWQRPNYLLNIEFGYENARIENINKMYVNLKNNIKNIFSNNNYAGVKNEIEKGLIRVRKEIDSGDKLYVINKVVYSQKLTTKFNPIMSRKNFDNGLKTLEILTKQLIPQSQNLDFVRNYNNGEVLFPSDTRVYWGYEVIPLEKIEGGLGFKVTNLQLNDKEQYYSLK